MKPLVSSTFFFFLKIVFLPFMFEYWSFCFWIGCLQTWTQQSFGQKPREDHSKLETFITGQELLQKLQQYSDVAMRGEESVTTLDNLEAQKQVKRMIQYIESRVEKIRAYLENRDRSLNVEVQRDTVQREIRQVCCT